MLPKKIQDILILASVFVTGASVLTIEILAIRILSPYYGNTLYTTSSVIGIVLMALSLGYYVGGRFADRVPEQKLFYALIFISGILTIIIHLLASMLLPLLGVLFSSIVGPIVASLVLFLTPAFCLGLLSPFAVKLHKQDDNAVGSRSGEVFFWSTLGSIVGSILAGFFLIPHVGVYQIIIATGVFLSLWGMGGFFLVSPLKRGMIILMALLLGYELVLGWYYFPKPAPGLVYQTDGVYERIAIVDSEWNGVPARFLFQDKSYSAAMYHDSRELTFDYTKYYSLYKLFRPQATNTLVIGGGAYSIPKALLDESPDMRVDVSEIEPELYSLSKQYFKLQDNERLVNYVEDGRHLLARNQKKYDAIIGDAYYSFFSIPIHLTTKEFFQLTKERLEKDGVFVGNFGGYLRGEGAAFIYTEMKTFKNVFPNSYFFAVVSPGTSAVQNIIFLGINGEKTIDFKSAAVLENSDPILRNLAQKNIDISGIDFSKYDEITDNFSPTEYLVSKVVKQWD